MFKFGGESLEKQFLQQINMPQEKYIKRGVAKTRGTEMFIVCTYGAVALPEDKVGPVVRIYGILCDGVIIEVADTQENMLDLTKGSFVECFQTATAKQVDKAVPHFKTQAEMVTHAGIKDCTKPLFKLSHTDTLEDIVRCVAEHLGRDEGLAVYSVAFVKRKGREAVTDIYKMKMSGYTYSVDLYHCPKGEAQIEKLFDYATLIVLDSQESKTKKSSKSSQ